MRTTLTIDDDVAAQLERLREERRMGLKDAVNAALRRGLPELLAEADEPAGPVELPVWSARPRIENVDDVAGVLELLDEPAPG